MPKPKGMMQGSPNDFQTPPEAISPLLKYIPKQWTIWECACGKGVMTKAFNDNGYSVIPTDILGGFDFITFEPSIYDCIITNPPYSLKQQFLERCYQLRKPFALLLPLTALETHKRQALMNKHGIEIILFDKRINFQTPSGKGTGAWFATAWFTWGFNIGKQITFTEL
jgi:hypothetical protein